MRQIERRLNALEQTVAGGGGPLLAVVLAAGKTPAAVEREVADLVRRVQASRRRNPGPAVIILDR